MMAAGWSGLHPSSRQCKRRGVINLRTSVRHKSASARPKPQREFVPRTRPKLSDPGDTRREAWLAKRAMATPSIAARPARPQRHDCEHEQARAGIVVSGLPRIDRGLVRGGNFLIVCVGSRVDRHHGSPKAKLWWNGEQTTLQQTTRRHVRRHVPKDTYRKTRTERASNPNADAHSNKIYPT